MVVHDQRIVPEFVNDTQGTLAIVTGSSDGKVIHRRVVISLHHEGSGVPGHVESLITVDTKMRSIVKPYGRFWRIMEPIVVDPNSLLSSRLHLDC